MKKKRLHKAKIKHVGNGEYSVMFKPRNFAEELYGGEKTIIEANDPKEAFKIALTRRRL